MGLYVLLAELSIPTADPVKDLKVRHPNLHGTGKKAFKQPGKYVV